MSTQNHPGSWDEPSRNDASWQQPTFQPPYANQSYGQPSGPSYGQPYGTAPVTGRVEGYISNDERMAATLAHGSAAIAALISVGWLPFLGPLIIYVMYKDKSPFVRKAAAGALNFAIAMTVLTIVGWVLTLTLILAVVGIPMIIVGGVGTIVFGVIGAVKTWGGEQYTYPGHFNIIK